MPRTSPTGNVHKTCGCGRAGWSACRHPWYINFKASQSQRLRAGQRFRPNLDKLIGFHPINLSEAKTEARRAIEAWLNGRDPAALQPSDLPTLDQALAAYHARPRPGGREVEQFGPISKTVVHGRPFGRWRLVDITRDVLEAFQHARPVVAGNRNLGLLRAMFRWAVVGGLVERTPFAVGSVAVIKLRPEAARSRRLQPGEGDRLLASARHLAPIILAALETGMRRGELLTLQWSQVRFYPKAEIFLPAVKTKAKRDRRVPISSALRPVLEARQHDPAGQLLPSDAYVFGDEIGRRRYSIHTSWLATCRRAGLTDLHFHDLRREAGSRWMDAGVPLATIQRWLGHANISQTSTYLGASLGGDESDMERFEQRIGRLAQDGISEESTGRDRIQTDTDPTELLNKNPITPNPTKTVH
jgi:integrase